jgi:hypothetical protein
MGKHEAHDIGFISTRLVKKSGKSDLSKAEVSQHHFNNKRIALLLHSLNA